MNRVVTLVFVMLSIALVSAFAKESDPGIPSDAADMLQVVRDPARASTSSWLDVLRPDTFRAEISVPSGSFALQIRVSAFHDEYDNGEIISWIGVLVYVDRPFPASLYAALYGPGWRHTQTLTVEGAPPVPLSLTLSGSG